MIPKTIHYIWLGGNPPSKLMLKCIQSWRRFCPDYQIKEWNETNFDINQNRYVKEAVEAKKWAFASDYMRLWVLYHEGGIYMDTDVQVVRSLDPFLSCRAFSGFEGKNRVPTGIMAAEKGFPFFKTLLDDYEHRSFYTQTGKPDLTTNVSVITQRCVEHGLVLNNQYQVIEGFQLFPSDYFCPKDSLDQRLHRTKNTVTVHHFNGSWVEETIYQRCKRKVLYPLLGAPLVLKLMSVKAKIKAVFRTPHE